MTQQRSALWRASVPHIALIIFYMFYLLAGGVLFHWLESKPTEKFVQSFEKQEGKIEADIDVLFRNYSKLNKTKSEEAKLDVLIDKLINKSEHFDRGAWDPDLYESPNAWSVSSAMLFCMITITTIGYGDLVPNTVAGRIAVILYSCIGIPLSFLLIADTGGLLARLASSSTAYVRRRLCGKNDQIFQPLEEDKDETNPKPDEYARQSGGGNPLSESDTARRNPQISLEAEPSYLSNVPEEDKEGTVPILVVVFILTTYICIGALSFSLSEGWSFTEGLYFTFITLTTIGYGDLYPSRHVQNNTMIPILVYILFGLCLVSMSVSLVMWRFMKLVTWMRNKVEYLCCCC
ncbi:TWiK family of potassium channels protein 7 [Holothuria leucospilota]|uniref:TWiK family of potassium channels protein 7 n=1 Tax=Holothuria leucospilota TaxID=206669 RepID=A0A9Q1C355_HOLLE|nr:TWiK family of potassium channels protein 7 [Holothuria leucospilota]